MYDMNGDEYWAMSAVCVAVFAIFGAIMSLPVLANWLAGSPDQQPAPISETVSVSGESGSLHDLFLEIAASPAGSQDTGLGMASAFATMARREGYQARVVTSSIVGRNGELQEHSWVLIASNGKEYIYDPTAQARFGSQADFFDVDPLNPPIRYVYPAGQEPLGGYKDFTAEEQTQTDSEWQEFAAS